MPLPVALERHLQRAIARYLNNLHHKDPGFTWRKRHGSPLTIAGDPDIYGLWHATPFEIELKRPGHSPTPLQQARLAEWQQAGAHTFVVHSLDELRQALSQIKNAAS